MNQNHSKRIRRTNYNLEKDILAGAKKVIEEHGFLKATLTSLSEASKTEPPIIYRWFKDLNGVFDKFTDGYKDWFVDVLDDSLDKKDPNTKNYFKRVFRTLIKGLYKDKSMLQILLWELSEKNTTTDRTLRSRESSYFNYLLAEHLYPLKNTHINIEVIFALLFGGIYYLCLIKDKGEFWGIDFNTRIGKRKLLETTDLICDWIFTQPEYDSRIMEIARKLKNSGVSNEIIAQSTSLTKEEIESIL
ncbi:MAG: TetR/AcrR family transcriptional regulator [Dysgonomonas sp.]|nr:TetR/AcrR family transcriptional regulator [Dysgonomonas sp.]